MINQTYIDMTQCNGRLSSKTCQRVGKTIYHRTILGVNAILFNRHKITSDKYKVSSVAQVTHTALFSTKGCIIMTTGHIQQLQNPCSVVADRTGHKHEVVGAMWYNDL